MNRLIIAILFLLLLVSCKNSTETDNTAEAENTEVADSTAYKGPPVEARLPKYRGEFYYSADAAVLKGRDFIYGVKRDSMAEVLAKMVAPVKQDEFDMVPVIVQGVVNKKEEGADGWDEILTIENIIKVSSKPAKPDIKIEENQ